MLGGIFRGEWMTMQRWLIAAAVDLRRRYRL
jgi:hypothetical protein